MDEHCSEKRFMHFERLKTMYKSYKIRMEDQVEVLRKEIKLKERIYDIMKDFSDIPYCRTNIRAFSIMYPGQNIFNKLNSDIRNAPLLYSFQPKIKKFSFVMLSIKH